MFLRLHSELLRLHEVVMLMNLLIQPHPVEQVHRCSHRLALLQIFKPSEGQTGVTWTHKDRISVITVHATGQVQHHRSVKAATL